MKKLVTEEAIMGGMRPKSCDISGIIMMTLIGAWAAPAKRAAIPARAYVKG